MMQRLLLLVALLLVPTSAFAHAAHLFNATSGLAHGVPDFCVNVHADDAVIVVFGDTLNISGTWEHKCLGIHGTVNILDDATVKADVIFVYADGVLNVGSSGDAATGVIIEIRDNAINTTLDPEQFGQSILSFGVVTMYGTAALTGNSTRSVIIRSANPSGVRGHFLCSQRCDANIQNVQFEDFGRTVATAPLDSATFDGSHATTHVGTNQIGRYSVHMHHDYGPLPAAMRAQQFYLINNRILRDSKWGITVHNSHFGLIQNNYCINAIGSCFVEEDGSETENKWIGNYAKTVVNNTTDGGGVNVNVRMNPTDCVDIGYDPEGRCASGFWLRGNGGIVMNNTIEDARVGIGWWSRCLEVNNGFVGTGSGTIGGELLNKCSAEKTVTIPISPGVDTSVGGNIKTDCEYFSYGVTGTCVVVLTEGREVSGNTCIRTVHCLEAWWTGRSSLTAAEPITNTTSIDASANVIAFFYSDADFDGFTVTTTASTEPVADTLAFSFFNDSFPNFSFNGHTSITNANVEGYDLIFSAAGQLRQMPSLTIADSTFYSGQGIRIDAGRQHQVNMTEEVFLNNVTFFAWDGGAATNTITMTNLFGSSEAGQRIFVDVINFQNSGQNFEFTWPDCETTDQGGAVFTCNPIVLWRPECTATVATVMDLAAAPDRLMPLCITSSINVSKKRLRFRGL